MRGCRKELEDGLWSKVTASAYPKAHGKDQDLFENMGASKTTTQKRFIERSRQELLEDVVGTHEHQTHVLNSTSKLRSLIASGVRNEVAKSAIKVDIKEGLKAHITSIVHGAKKDSDKPKDPAYETETFLEKLRKLQAERLGGLEMLKKYNGDVIGMLNVNHK